MCYVIYVGGGKENIAERQIARLVPEELYTRVFHPCRHMRKRIGGSWVDIYEWLVPGYVFVVTDRVGEFYQALKRVPRLTKLLGREFENGEPAFTPLGHDEEKWLAAMLGEEWFRTGSSTDGADPVAELSQVGFDENDRVVILSGPLMSFTGQVRRINLHKRYAEVEVNFMGKSQLLHLGIDVLVKAEEVERCQ